jgi:hypothetical protein
MEAGLCRSMYMTTFFREPRLRPNADLPIQNDTGLSLMLLLKAAKLFTVPKSAGHFWTCGCGSSKGEYYRFSHG